MTKPQNVSKSIQTVRGNVLKLRLVHNQLSITNFISSLSFKEGLGEEKNIRK